MAGSAGAGVTKRCQPSVASEAKNSMAATISQGCPVAQAMMAMAEITTR